MKKSKKARPISSMCFISNQEPSRNSDLCHVFSVRNGTCVPAPALDLDASMHNFLFLKDTSIIQSSEFRQPVVIDVYLPSGRCASLNLGNKPGLLVSDLKSAAQQQLGTWPRSWPPGMKWLTQLCCCQSFEEVSCEHLSICRIL
jgi:hypothetical protein